MDPKVTDGAGAENIADLSLVRRDGRLALEGVGGSEVPASIELVNRDGAVVGTYTLALAEHAAPTSTARIGGTQFAQLQGMNINVGQLLG